MRHTYRLHARELEQILWQALTEGRGDHLELTDGVAARLAEAARAVPPTREIADATPPARKKPPARRKQGTTTAHEIDRGAIEAALARTRGNVTHAARDLGLANRYALYRLMRKLDMTPAADQEPSAEHGPPPSGTGQAPTPARRSGDGRR
ncbi:MAG: helix-turn-helix domain-containing protein [Minicystis sp.]